MAKNEPISADKLHSILDDVIYGLMDKSMPPGEAKEISNAAGKKIALVKAQIDYANMWGGRIDINFMSDNELNIEEGNAVKNKQLN
jgi:hypothetical protein